MGEVYRARDTRLDREVAVKVLPTDFAADAELLARFRREAQAISSLNHPHICTLFDIGEQDGSHYLVMELIDGESLADALTRGALPLPQVLKYGAQIAEALDAAHRQGIVHRDVKPGNVMLTKGGAKLLDFGLATAVETAPPVATSTQMETRAKPLTEKGTVLGTFQYMAPEQLEGLEADPRTDLFGLGALLYEMATGRRAFDGESRTSLIAAIVSSQPEPISQVVQLTPPALDHVVFKCLEKDPDDRWQSARDVAAQLRWIGEAGSQAGTPAQVTVRRKTRARLAWGLAAVFGGLLLASNLFWFTTAPAPPQTIHLSIPARTTQYKDTGSGLISPDGRRVAFWAQRHDDEWRRALLDLASGSVTLLDGTGSVHAWSPDGREMLIVTEGRLKALDVVSGAQRDITGVDGIVRGAAWNEEEVVLFGVEGEGIYRVSAVGGAAERIIAPDPKRFEVAPSYPHFLSDGKRFLYVAPTRRPDGDSPNLLRVGALDTSETSAVGEIGSMVRLLDSGFLLHVFDGTLAATRFDEDSLELSGRPIPIADGVGYFQPVASAEFDSARNGTITYRRREVNQSVVWFDADGVEQGIVVPEGGFNGVDISPDGEQAAIAVVDPRTGTSDLWLYGLARGTASRLTVDRAEEQSPVWSPDGNTIVFASDRDRLPDMFRIDLDGTGEWSLVFGTDQLEFNSDLSPDGRQVLFTTNIDGGNWDLWMMELDAPDTARPFVSHPAFQHGGRFSPDGQLVAYVSDQTDRREIWIKPFAEAGRSVQVSTEGASEAQWAPEGRTLYYASRDRMFSVDLEREVAATHPRPKLLFEAPHPISNFAVAPDGRFLVVLRDDSIVEPAHVIVNWKPPEE
jgi:Tol biopolymer transport system component